MNGNISKYQEALDYINGEAIQEITNSYFRKHKTLDGISFEEFDKNLTKIQELVDRATPKKPYKQMMTSCLEGVNSNRTAIYQLSCRNCDSTFEENCDDLNCRYCGQAIDWSEE